MSLVHSRHAPLPDTYPVSAESGNAPVLRPLLDASRPIPRAVSAHANMLLLSSTIWPAPSVQ